MPELQFIGKQFVYNYHLTVLLQSKERALTLETSEAMPKLKPGKPSLVFASSKYVGKKYLDALTSRVEYAPLPFAPYRLERGL